MKKFVVVMICLLLVASLAACSSTATTPAATTTAASTTAATTTGGTTAATTIPEVPLPDGAGVAAEAVSEKPLKIGVLTFQSNPFFYPVKDGALAAGEYLKNFNATVEFIDMGSQMTVEESNAALEAALVKGYDGVCVSPVFDGTEIYIDKLVDAGIPVITFVAEGSIESKRLFFYGQESISAGQEAGKMIEKICGGEGTVAVITGTFGALQHEQRMKGGVDYLKANTTLNVTEPVEGKDKAEKIYELTSNFITTYDDLKAVYVMSGGTYGAAKAIKDAGKLGKVFVVGYDAIPENLDYIKEGTLYGVVDQDAFGQGFNPTVMMFNYLVKGTLPEGKFVPVNNINVTIENLAELYPEYAK